MFLFIVLMFLFFFFFFFQAEDGIRDADVTGVQTCALPIHHRAAARRSGDVDGGTGASLRHAPGHGSLRPRDSGWEGAGVLPPPLFFWGSSGMSGRLPAFVALWPAHRGVEPEGERTTFPLRDSRRRS